MLRGPIRHSYNPIEQDANARGIQYFYKRTDGHFKWNFDKNPIGVNENNWTMADYETEEFQNALRLIRSQVRVHMKDYMSWLWGSLVFQVGMDNAIYYNGKSPYRRYSGRSTGNRSSRK